MYCAKPILQNVDSGEHIPAGSRQLRKGAEEVALKHWTPTNWQDWRNFGGRSASYCLHAHQASSKHTRRHLILCNMRWAKLYSQMPHMELCSKKLKWRDFTSQERFRPKSKFWLALSINRSTRIVPKQRTPLSIEDTWSRPNSRTSWKRCVLRILSKFPVPSICALTKFDKQAKRTATSFVVCCDEPIRNANFKLRKSANVFKRIFQKRDTSNEWNYSGTWAAQNAEVLTTDNTRGKNVCAKPREWNSNNKRSCVLIKLQVFRTDAVSRSIHDGCVPCGPWFSELTRMMVLVWVTSRKLFT